MALDASGKFTMSHPSRHFEMHVEVAKRFLDVNIDYAADDNGVRIVEVWGA